MTAQPKLEYQDISREVRDVLPENDNETSIHRSYHPMRTIYPDQCWEIDHDRTVLTQYIARHPAAVRSTFILHDRLLIDDAFYSVNEIYHGRCRVTSWAFTVIWYHLRKHNVPPRSPPPIGRWCVMPGDFIVPQATPSPPSGAIYSHEVHRSDVVYNMDDEYMKARNRYELVVQKLTELRGVLEDGR